MLVDIVIVSGCGGVVSQLYRKRSSHCISSQFSGSNDLIFYD